MHVYDFTTTPKDIKDNKNTSESRLINPSVLGLVFEKLNGYKEGSFYTPSFITSYMCKESVTTIVLDKFNQKYNIECEDLKELKNYLKNSYKEDKRKEYLQVLLTLRICDPAVGSGHFLVSALNEMVRIAYELGLIASLPLDATLELENDEILIKISNKPFIYTRPSSEKEQSHQIQKELFELKKSIIENCLFGVDINPNSCEITNIRQEQIKDLKPLLQKQYQDFYNSTADIYTYFFALSYRLLKDKGFNAFITSNKYARAKYGAKLRELLLKKTTIVSYMELNALKVFESAAVDTSIISFIKQEPPKESDFKYYEPTPDDKNDLKSARSLPMRQNALSTESFIFANATLLDLRDKMESVGTPLKDWDIQINYGIKTGANEAFIITTEKREEILNACKTQEERKHTETLIKPILRGKDIKRYAYEWAHLWVINTHNGYTSNLKSKIPPIDIEKYPALKSHLDSHYDTIATRFDQGDTPYHLRNCAYLEDFEKEKIVYGEIVQEPRFYLDNGECELGYFYAEATSFILTGEHLRYLLGMLHSKLITFAFKTFYAGGGLGESGYRYKKAFIERLPIPKITPQNQELAHKITDGAKAILALKEKDPKANTQKLEKEIDALVYQLYNLTDEEIKTIEEGQEIKS